MAASRKRELVLQDLVKTCALVLSDAAKLQKKLASAATKMTISQCAKILKFHVDRLINNRVRGTRLTMRTTDGKPVASIADLT